MQTCTQAFQEHTLHATVLSQGKSGGYLLRIESRATATGSSCCWHLRRQSKDLDGLERIVTQMLTHSCLKSTHKLHLQPRRFGVCNRLHRGAVSHWLNLLLEWLTHSYKVNPDMTDEEFELLQLKIEDFIGLDSSKVCSILRHDRSGYNAFLSSLEVTVIHRYTNASMPKAINAEHNGMVKLSSI